LLCPTITQLICATPTLTEPPLFALIRNYEQLGLKFKLFSAEVLFNKGLALIYMGNLQDGIAEMEEARKEKVTEEHAVIDDAIRDRGDGYTVFSIVSADFLDFSWIMGSVRIREIIVCILMSVRS
jgi:hypothetical protein